MYQIGLQHCRYVILVSSYRSNIFGWSIASLPTTCSCSSRFSIQNCMSCKKEGFVSIRHNDLRDLNAKMLSEVYKDTEIERK